MYIPIGPSKKQLYKILFFMFLCLISLTMFKGCVKALVYSNDVNYYSRTSNPMGFPNRKSISLLYTTSNTETLGTITWNFDTQYVVSCETEDCLIVIPYMYSLTNKAISTGNETLYHFIEVEDTSIVPLIGGPSMNVACNVVDNNIECVVQNNTVLSFLTVAVNKVLDLNTDSSVGFSMQTLGIWLIYNMGENTQALQNTSQNTSEINNKISDSSTDNEQTNNTISNLASGIHSNGTITNLLTLPITFLQQLVNGFNGSCSPFVIGTLWGTEISLSCINTSSFGAIFNIVDIFVSGFLAYAFGCKMIKLFNKFTNMKEGGLEQAYD